MQVARTRLLHVNHDTIEFSRLIATELHAKPALLCARSIRTMLYLETQGGLELRLMLLSVADLRTSLHELQF